MACTSSKLSEAVRRAATSHGVLLARALGVPAVTGIGGLTRHVAAGDALIIDGDAGLVIARENGAEGIGLCRTEFPFIVRDGLPTVEEQLRIYAKAYEAFPDGPVTFRLLDLAGDKFLPGGQLGSHETSFTATDPSAFSSTTRMSCAIRSGHSPPPPQAGLFAS